MSPCYLIHYNLRRENKKSRTGQATWGVQDPVTSAVYFLDFNYGWNDSSIRMRSHHVGDHPVMVPFEDDETADLMEQTVRIADRGAVKILLAHIVNRHEVNHPWMVAIRRAFE
jgi:hypothetical protein